MSGLAAVLDIGKTAIGAAQYGMGIAGKNIANVDNQYYSRQEVKTSSEQGFLFGTEVYQSVNNLLEARLTEQRSSLAAYEEADSYLKIIEGFFDEISNTPLSDMMNDFWNSWQDLANNPQGSVERSAVYDYARTMSEFFSSADQNFHDLSKELSPEIDGALTQINSLSKQIAHLNETIVSMGPQNINNAQFNGSVNDLRDIRNSLVNELAELIDIQTFARSNGSLTVTASNGFLLVGESESQDLSWDDGKVVWMGTHGPVDITDKITGGKVGGLLTIRDHVLPQYQADLNELASQMIWAVNYQHSQGAGLEYFSDPVVGDYGTDASGLLSGYAFGDKIDYAKDFRMWIQDTTAAETSYSPVDVNMGISEAAISNWGGTAPGGIQSIYVLTVLESAQIGDRIVMETDGTGLGVAQSGADISAALDNAIAEQSLKVYGSPSGTVSLDVADSGGNVLRSAASIAGYLDTVSGVSAYASSSRATIDLGGVANAQDGDRVTFSVYVDGLFRNKSFVVDSTQGSLSDQFGNALAGAAGELNEIFDDKDLFVDGLTISSDTGKTLGIQGFEVQDNAGLRIDAFNSFDSGDTVAFTMGSSTVADISISIDLTGVDTADQSAMADAFYDAMEKALAGNSSLSVVRDKTSNSVILRSTDGSAITLKDGAGDTGSDATFSMTALSGSTQTSGDAALWFDGSNDSAVIDSDTLDTDTIGFQGITVTENSAAGVQKAAVITGTVTALMDPEMMIYSDFPGPGGIFNGNYSKIGSSIMTLGGDGGYSGFDTADSVDFEVDGIAVSYTVGALDTTDLDYAQGLETALTAGLGPDYQVFRTGTSVSILKNKDLEDPIVITGFTDTGTGDATLRVATGTGQGTNEPVNDMLDAGNPFHQSSTSTLYDKEGVIQWAKYNQQGLATGEYGLVTVSDTGTYFINEGGSNTLWFDLGPGELVAGNTLTLNTDTSGHPDPLDFRVTGKANSVNDTYTFTVLNGGKVGHLPAQGEDPLIIEWSNGNESGRFVIKGEDPPLTPNAPVEVKLDGMTLSFRDGTLVDGDVFTISTNGVGVPQSVNENGQRTGETLGDWHWTINSFADQFNRNSAGVRATVTSDNRLAFQASDQYYAVENVNYSGSNGFSEDNCSIAVLNRDALDFAASDVQFVRSSGIWGIVNDPLGGISQMIPPGGDDDGFGVDVNSDGVADFEIRFKTRVSGDGNVSFDLIKHDPNDISFAFSDDASSDSGLLAAAGINTFFSGQDAATMSLNRLASDSNYIAAARINSSTGLISQGDNQNSLALSAIQFKESSMVTWNFSQIGEEPYSGLTRASLDTYYSSMIGSMGVTSRSMESSMEFTRQMVLNLTDQRNTVSAVSLDEEMIQLIKYQHAFSAAAKLVTASDEMLNTLIAMR
ncbi:MAG: flagellar hook-associated protein FlgK [Pseudomonadota bacterium]